MPSRRVSMGRPRTIVLTFGVAALGTIVALQLGVVGSHAAVSSPTAVSQTMHAVVNEDDSIGLTFDDGSAVGNQSRTIPTIPPGTYSVSVLDNADIHNFHLLGPGVDDATSIDNTQTATWSVTLQPGQQYKFQCDNHPDFMWGWFQTSGAAASGSSSSGGTTSGSSSGGSTSGSGSSTSGGSSSNGGSSSSGSSTPVAALLGTLSGSISSAGKVTLTLGGKQVSKLKSGRYRITVVDRSSSGSFVVQEAGHPAVKLTGASFTGTHSVVVDLTAGKWTFAVSSGTASSGTKPKSSFVVS